MSQQPPDPMMRRTAPTHSDQLSIFDHIGTITEQRTTSQIAAASASNTMPGRRQRILELLAIAPQTLFELAAKMNCHAHQISGRLTDLRADGLIELANERRPNPATHFPAEVYRLRR